MAYFRHTAFLRHLYSFLNGGVFYSDIWDAPSFWSYKLIDGRIEGLFRMEQGVEGTGKGGKMKERGEDLADFFQYKYL